MASVELSMPPVLLGPPRGSDARPSEQWQWDVCLLVALFSGEAKLPQHPFGQLARATCPRALLWPPGFATGTGSKGYAFSSALTPIIAVCRQEGSAGGTSHTNEQGEDGHQQGAQAGSRFDAEFADMDDAALEEIDALTGAAQADGQAGSADGERVCVLFPPPR